MNQDRRLSAISVLAFACMTVFHQPVSGQDDTLFRIRTLDAKEIKPYEPAKEKMVSAANRIEENPDELSVRTYIITQEEIIRNGYTSLNDILRTLPGFRTSEPAHAYLGESFLMRGLMGNMYTKLLINGIPILPSAAPGFPLGSALPVRQAERIEIILGPASTIYGSDALSGVINFVIPEVERPVEALAGISVGNSGRNEFNLMIGGKAGGRKHVVQYQLFGTSVLIGDRNLNLPDTLIRVDTNKVGNNMNYAGDAADKSIPRIAKMAHESRQLGASLTYRNFRFMAIQMHREDHSAFGSHPQEIAYHDPNTFIADNIGSFQLQYDKQFKKLWLHTNLSALRYFVDINSGYIGIDHPLANGRNFSYAWSKDYNAEQLAGYKWEKFSLLGGVNFTYRSGIGYQGYIIRPYDEGLLSTNPEGNWVVQNSEDTSSSIAPYSLYNSYKLKDYSAFLQGNYKNKRMNITAGVRMDKPAGQDIVFSPRIGAFVKINEVIRLRGMYAQGFRMPGGFYTYNNYRYRKFPQEPQGSYKREEADLQPEQLSNIEGGFIFMINRHLKIDLHYFSHRMSNTITPTQEYPEGPAPPGQDPNFFMGYSNFNTLSKLQGLEAYVHFESRYFKADIAGQYNIGSEEIAGIDTLDFYRSVPQFQFHSALHGDIKTFRVSLYGNYFDDFNGALVKLNDSILTKSAEGFFALDIVLGNQFSRRLFGYIRVKNLLDAEAKGISAPFVTKHPLEYIPQEKRVISLGITFSLN
ncbi:MAG: outer membrane receptor protein [Bacteroidetes bacterium]|nr:MAG: outer membrane receptor protein [Bacteroidota bacterium]